MSDSPLFKLDELTKPATVLIEKISDAVGGIFKPYQIVRVAKAEAEADRIQASSQIQITDLHRRAMHRFLEEEAKMQTNIEDITQKALPLLKEESAPQDVEDNWITNFFDKSRIVSDADMQQLWAKVLAGESNTPGTFSRRTVNLLPDLDKRDAELFKTLCGFGWIIGGVIPLVFDSEIDLYNRHGINFETLSHLESLGLIQFGTLAGFQFSGTWKNLAVSYYGRQVVLTFPGDGKNTLATGKVLLTKAGKELATVCGSTPVEGFFEFVYEQWGHQSLIPKAAPEPDSGLAN
jgi:hypothetical protein